jgi:hypothetical protein
MAEDEWKEERLARKSGCRNSTAPQRVVETTEYPVLVLQTGSQRSLRC